MVVAIDATPLSVSSGGVRRYTEELARALGHAFPDDTYHLLSDQPFEPPTKLPPNVFTHPACASTRIERWWWTIGLARAMSRLGCSVFHGTEFSVPYLPFRASVLTLQDLSPWMNLSWQRAAGRVRRRTPVLLRLGIATMVITPTESIRKQAITAFGLHPSRVVAVPDAAAPHFAPASSMADATPYFLFLGTIEPRKNVPVLIDAWRMVRSRHPVNLVIAGRRRADAPELPVEPGITVTGEVPEEQLAAPYSGAIACVYPSHYEGFGLPPLEAMQCGCPVIASRDPAIVEVCGDAALHVDAADVTALACAMELLIEDCAERNRRREMGAKRAAQFSWQQSAVLTRKVYAEAIRRFVL
jgi:glycosyltransferase involved in cell wall biosynthesis